MDEGVLMEPDGPVIKSVTEVAAEFWCELNASIPEWVAELEASPDELHNVENDVHHAMARGADRIVAGLISLTLQSESLQRQREASRKSFQYPLDRGRKRTVQVKLLGGLLIWVCSLYFQPRRQRLTKDSEKKPGIYLGAAELGIVGGASPGLLGRVARQAALCPSLEFAHQELTRSGVEIDKKSVRRIAYECGEKMLRLRKCWMDQWQAGKLPAGDELAGKRVSVQLDGGRTKIRKEMRPAKRKKPKTNEDGLLIEDTAGRSKKRPQKEYDTDWREPKLMTIFVHDENGKMDREFKATIDATFLGPDAAAELIAMHLHRLGAARAASITFCADGAPWIWDRVPQIVEKAQLKDVRIHEVLDNYHAAHHISQALKSLGLGDQERMPLYRDHRTRLRNGQWRRVVEELKELAAAHPDDSKVYTDIAYLEKHGTAGRLRYVQFQKQGIPLGSGAVESRIRQVINQRMKNNSTFWKEENAEKMLQLRAHVISDRWDEQLLEIRILQRQDARTDWRWDPQPMRFDDEANCTTAL